MPDLLRGFFSSDETDAGLKPVAVAIEKSDGDLCGTANGNRFLLNGGDLNGLGGDQVGET